MDHEAEIVKIINKLSGSRSPYDVLYDWVKCTALSISNTSDFFHGKIWKQREEEYLRTIRPYKKDACRFSEMTGLLSLALDDDMSDMLGKIYMAAGCGNKNTGQFFTPFHLSKMVAELTVPDDISPENPLIINEPSAGGGGMIIAVAKALKEKGVNFQRSMKVVAQDLDWKGVYMTYIQLSLLGIKATVVQGDTLCEPFDSKNYPKERILYTPAQRGMLL